MNMSNHNNILNVKIIYKKPTNYDEVSNTTINDLDNSVNNDNISVNNSFYNNEVNNKIIKEIKTDISQQNNMDYDNDYIDIFMDYLNDYDIEFSKLNNPYIFERIIKHFISENKLLENKIIIFINKLKNKLDIFNKENQINNIDDMDINLELNNLDNNNNYLIGNFNNLIKNNNIIYDFYNYDINTWILIGIILISFIILIMFITSSNKIKKK